MVAPLRELALARGLDSLAGEERLRAGRRALGSTGKSAVLGLVVGVTVGIVLGTTGALMQSKDERWFWIAVFPLAGGIVGAGVGAVAGFATGLVASSAGESFVLPAGDWIVVPNPRAQLLALSP